MSPRQLAAVSLARAAVVTIAGAVIAVAVAIAASPLMPVGAARLAEPRSGPEANLAILGAGFAAVILLPVLAVAPSAWRAARRAGQPLGGPGRLTRPGGPGWSGLSPWPGR